MAAVRVLTVTNMYPSRERPGRGTFVRTQVESLRGLGVEVEVFATPTEASRLNYLRGAREVRRRVTREQFDLIHVHFGLCGLMTLGQSRCPVVISYCGGDLIHRYEPLISWRNRVISRWLARRASAVIVKSQEMKRLLGDPRAHVIPNGIDLQLFRPLDRTWARQQLGLAPDRLSVLFVGDYAGSRVKGFDLVEQAVARLASLLPEREVDLIPVYGEPQERLPLYMNAADVLAVASLWEGSPNAVKEALACNLRVVSVDVGDVRQLLGADPDCRIVARIPEAMAQALSELLSPPRRGSGRERMRALSSVAVARRVLGVYEEVLNGRSVRERGGVNESAR